MNAEFAHYVGAMRAHYIFAKTELDCSFSGRLVIYDQLQE